MLRHLVSRRLGCVRLLKLMVVVFRRDRRRVLVGLRRTRGEPVCLRRLPTVTVLGHLCVVAVGIGIALNGVAIIMAPLNHSSAF